jgi:hypothetical protein
MEEGVFSLELNFSERARYHALRKIISCALELKEEIIHINMTMGIHLTVPPLI